MEQDHLKDRIRKGIRVQAGENKLASPAQKNKLIYFFIYYANYALCKKPGCCCGQNSN